MEQSYYCLNNLFHGNVKRVRKATLNTETGKQGNTVTNFVVVLHVYNTCPYGTENDSQHSPNRTSIYRSQSGNDIRATEVLLF